jgi:hypothetical protein
MRKSITLLFVLAFVTVGVASLWAQEQEQTIYQLLLDVSNRVGIATESGEFRSA